MKSFPGLRDLEAGVRCSCPNCFRTFKNKYSLARHLFSHELVKRHVCEVCSKAFSLKQYLTEHKTVHSKARPHKCPFPGCNKAYRQAGKLSLHKKSKHQSCACPEHL